MAAVSSELLPGLFLERLTEDTQNLTGQLLIGLTHKLGHLQAKKQACDQLDCYVAFCKKKKKTYFRANK
jgi:hypothetical protein